MKRRTFLGAAMTAPMISTAAWSQEALSMWARSDVANVIRPFVDTFNAKGKTQIKLDIVVAREMVQKYAAAAAARSAPDFLLLDLIYTPAFASADQLQDLSPWTKEMPYFQSLSPAHRKLGELDGKLYGLPFSAEGSVLVYNKKLFREAGLDPEKPPKNWGEITDAAVKIRALGGDRYGYYVPGAGAAAFRFLPVVWANGGEVLSADGKKATIDSPQLREAIGFYRDLWAKKVMPESVVADTGPDALTGFAAGRVGMTITGAFAIGVLTTRYPDVEFGVTPIPGKTGGFASFAGGDNIVVSRGTRKLPAIREFVDFAYSLEGQSLLGKYGSLPVRGDIAAAALKENDPRYLTVAEAVNKGGRTPRSTVYNDLFNSLNGPWVTLHQRAIFGNDVDGAIAQAQATFQRIINEAN